jgi:hypothetical protein
MNQIHKTKKTIVVVALALMLLLALAACGGGKSAGNDTPAAPAAPAAANAPAVEAPAAAEKPAVQDNTDWATQLVGTWKEVDINASYTFNADGTGAEGLSSASFAFDWTLSGSTLKLSYSAADVAEYEIQLDGNTLYINEDGTDFEYERQ